MAITLNHISKSFGEKKVLKEFDCTLENGSWTLITGPSGCGKTTLFRILLGLEQADSGSIEQLPTKQSAVFQENRLCEELTTADNIRLVMGIDKRNTRIKEAKIDNVLRELGLIESKNQRVVELSGGMKRRTAIARAVLADAEMYLLDEPFYGLDKESKEATMSLLVRYLKDKTTILITHDKEAIEYLVKRNVISQEIRL